ncbi:GNAT family N-acetyltransferase [Egicoccus sp. AB-alg6-2]|uniref:GNAT family N-acetyltransferase n=1 Tax=Egicoccus sp. AB-alg6-2 TaxID=3242692 RepID=UPI00359D1BAA
MPDDLPPSALPTPPDGFSLRRATWDDLFTVAGLYAACSLARVGAVTTRPGDLRVRWLELGGPQDVLLVEHPDASPALVAALEFQADVDPWTDELDLHVEGKVHPAWEGHGLATYLLDHAERRARREAWLAGRATAVLRTTVVDGDERARSFFAHRGFVPVRHLLQLRLDLHASPPQAVWPAGVGCRTFVPGRDEEALWSAHLAAFADNPEFLPLELHDWVEFHTRDPGFDPSLVLLAEADPGIGVSDADGLDAPTVVGFAWCRAGAEGAAEEGWIRDLAVVPAWQGRGIGMALLRAAFGAFRTRGLTGVRLEVDDVTMDGAVGLYRRAGMRIARRTDVLEQLLVTAASIDDPGPPPLPPAA